MRVSHLALAGGLILCAMPPAQAGLFSSSSASSDSCSSVSGDVAIAARTPEVDLYTDTAGTQKAQTLEQDKFPACTPITGRSPNMMLQVQIGGAKYWVEPHMVKYRFTGKTQPVCRNLAMGSNQVKAGATRGLGEGCPKTGGSH
jgi:hypothetical protein